MRDMQADLVSNTLRKNVASLGANKYHYLLRTKIFENYPLSLPEMDNYFGSQNPSAYEYEIELSADRAIAKMLRGRALHATAHKRALLLEQSLVRHVFARAFFNLTTPIPESYLHDLVLVSRDVDLLYVLGSFAVNGILLSRSILGATYLPDELELIRLLESAPVAEDTAVSFVYFATHIVIASSSFYTGAIRKDLRGNFVTMLQSVETTVAKFYRSLSFDAKLEYLLACKMVGYESKLYGRIVSEVDGTITPLGYIVDPHMPGGIAAAEHRSMLYLGLIKWDVPWLE